ncbi:fumarylacetoacetate hydrolase family protein [Halogeometricum limi]|uniref:2-keto-4-pentenoate hydratase/2-oxohepta-3-ene-1,7-dioic acid hydratase (Catechol pathway) n=1 Tax=Halogeometricum limi TaxID=555875 RepID=A0A1I6IA85_9EURY|nr:fumarylacetoacetate hydrolase family protein [Halogeometricum limi]SFR63675.1 2-keto-4-pentenoate hydratase/2-oxohepta-3-ene-1,7-dioic acid hydratase (catechol pathway) [Halogeometricum limi]
MRFVRYDDDQLGVLTDDGTGVIDLTDRLGLDGDEPLVEYIEGGYDAGEYADEDPDHDVEDVTLRSPVGRPGKVIAAPLNYENHIEEAISDRDITTDEWFSIKDKGYFLKAPSSVVGPDHGVELPFTDRRTDHEIELAFVMGSDAKDVSAEEAWDHIFGYTILLDISLRGDQDRSNRKSYDTFTVVGPCVTTVDEIPDPQDLQMELRLNGERRQYENTGDMVYTCADVVQYASLGATLEVGDIVTTGTPEGVSELSDGDTIEAEIERIGSMTVDVRGRDVSYADANVQKGGQE